MKEKSVLGTILKIVGAITVVGLVIAGVSSNADEIAAGAADPDFNLPIDNIDLYFS